MSGFDVINLAKLPAPAVIQTPSFEELLAEMKARAIEEMPELEAYLDLESEPATKLLEVCAYFRVLDRAEFNDGARANMLALATGTDLENLAAFWGVERLTVQVGDDTIDPAIPEILESDAALRSRTQLSLEGHTTAGSRGAYTFHALSADGTVKDVDVASPTPGEVAVTVLGHDGDGAPGAALLQTVTDALNHEDVRPLTDLVTVAGATILDYSIEAELTLYNGPDAALVLAAAEAAITAYVTDHHQLGHDIKLSGIYAALHQPGVQGVDLIAPIADIAVASTEAAHCAAAPIITVGGRDV